MKKFLGFLALTSVVALAGMGLTAPAPKPVNPDAVRVVMFEMTYVPDSLVITHAQVIGGYGDVKDCTNSIGKVSQLGISGLEKGEMMKLWCVDVKAIPGINTSI